MRDSQELTSALFGSRRGWPVARVNRAPACRDPKQAFAYGYADMEFPLEIYFLVLKGEGCVP